MMTGEALLASEFLLRGGAAVIFILVATLLLRDRARDAAAFLGAAFSLGTAAFVLCSATDAHRWLGEEPAAVALGLSAGNNFIFWLFARCLFAEEFIPRRWHAGAWLAIAGAGLVFGLWHETVPTAWALLMRKLLAGQSLGFALLALGQTLAGWRQDLVERRRALRVFILFSAALYTLATSLPALTAQTDARLSGTGFGGALGIFVIAAVIAFFLLRAETGDLLGGSVKESAPAPEPPRAPAPVDGELLSRLEQVMTSDRLYRRESLTIGELASHLALPEYRLRRLINQGLGYRNFASFLNRYRLEDARAALADPDQAEVPILTIALDAGFNSPGPFNRAFKTASGQTPSEYRRQALALCENTPREQTSD